MVTSRQFNGTSSAENAFEVNTGGVLPLNCDPPASKITMRNIQTGDLHANPASLNIGGIPNYKFLKRSSFLFGRMLLGNRVISPIDGDGIDS